MYIVTRQLHCGQEPIVEVSRGDMDGVNPDALVEKYEGEFGKFTDPREAVKVALRIREQWAKDIEGLPQEDRAIASIRDNAVRKVAVGCGITWGGDCPLDPIEPSELEAWAVREYNNLEKCARVGCGEILEEGNTYTHDFADEKEKFCSEYCTEIDLEELLKEGEE